HGFSIVFPRTSAKRFRRRCSKDRNRWCSTRPRTAFTRRNPSSCGVSASSELPFEAACPIFAGMNEPTGIEETYSDRLLGFTLPARHARGRAVRLDGLLD